VGGIPEIFNSHCGMLVPPCDERALADAIERSLSRNWDPAAISAQGQRTWSEAASELLGICERFVRGQHQSSSGVWPLARAAGQG
jgi:hypothetical protein